jgi:Predicted amidophosphoribosyltransferases
MEPAGLRALCNAATGRRKRRAVRRLPTGAWSLLQVRAALVYAAPVDRLLRRFKFHQDLAAGRLLAQLMVEALQQAPRPQAVVPVSLHRRRLRQRGYDQALELARPLARELGLPLVEGLQRVRATHAQSELDAPRAAATCAAPSWRGRACPRTWRWSMT